MAPAPLIDKFPVIIGQNVSLTYAASASRLALSGYRYQLVDLLDELLDHDPHTFSVLSKRILSVAGARVEVSPSSDDDLAVSVADMVREQLEGIPKRTQAFAQLLWALYYGISAQEILWAREQRHWRIRGLHFVHPRRLSFADSKTWELYVWDQGSLSAFDGAKATGLCIEQYPNKFVVHCPVMRGAYATREGIGRMIATHMLFKRLALRVGAQDFERFVKPWAIAYFRTADNADPSKPRTAQIEDIDAADAALRALGAGSLSGATLPDSVRVELLRAASNLDHDKFLEYLDSSITKAVLGQTFTTQSGKFGSRNSAETGKRETRELAEYDAQCLADTIRDSLVRSIVELNAPGCALPLVKFHVDTPDPHKTLELAKLGASVGMPIDGTKIAQIVGLPLVVGDEGLRLQLVRPADVSRFEPETEEDDEGASADTEA